MFEKIREDGSKRLRMDAYPTLFAILPHRSAGSHQQIDRLLYNHLLPCHLVTTPMPQLMSRTPQWLLQSMIMIIRMFARVYFGISAIYKAWCGEGSYCFVGMLPCCISMMSYFSEPSPWILIQPFSGPVFSLMPSPHS